MVFDDLEEAYKVYNDYAYKTGFGIRIGNTKYSTAHNVPKDTILNRVFECVHTGKIAAATKGARNRKDDAANVLDSTVDMSSFTSEKQAKDKGMQMDLSDTRQRNRLLRYDCKAHMHVGKRNGSWTVTVFTEKHTHSMVKQLGRRRYYRSHRKVPEEDFQLLQTLHNQNITTAQIMGCLGNVCGGDLRTLGYVKRDVSNIRTMLRNDVSLRDMSLTIEYFEKRKAESLSFFYATQLDENNAQYELCQNLMLDREDNAGFTMETTGRPLWGSWNIEAQSQKFYTPEVFERFQKMISTSTRFHPIHVEAEILSFDLVPNIGLDIKTYRVEVVAAESLYSCGCNSFEMCGLLCPHIIRVMVHLNVQEIPSRYLLHCWSAAATTTPPDPGANTIRFGVPTTNTLKYNALCRKMNNLASDACYAEDTYAIVSSMVDEACKVVTNMRRARNGLQQQADQLQEEIQPEQHEAQQRNNEAQHKVAVDEAHGSGNLQNPPRNKPKGRPKETEKRHKPLVELRDEANKKRQKKTSEPKSKKKPAAKVKRKARVKKCPYYNEEGHTIQECTWMKLTRQADEEKAAGVELRL
ncbi:hypothetical protein ACQ4PT_054985 [Festuca glaucescens]